MVDVNVERKAGGDVPFPRWGAFGAIAAVMLMVVVSVHLWSALPVAVVTDTRGGGRDPVMVPRWFFVSLMPLVALLLAAIHVVMLHHEAARELPPSTDHLIALLMAAFLVGMGPIIWLVRMKEEHQSLPARWWARARGPVGGGIALVGVATSISASLLPEPVMAVYLMGLMGPVIFVGSAIPFIGDQGWKKASEGDS